MRIHKYCLIFLSISLTGLQPVMGQSQKPPTENEKKVSAAAGSHFDRAEKLASERKFSEAIEEYQLAIHEMPQNEAAYFGKALAQSQAGRNLEAIQSYLDALRIKPDLWEAELNLGILLMSERDWEQASGHLERAESLNLRSFQAAYLTGKAQALLDKQAQAEQHFLRAFDLAQERVQKFDASTSLAAFYLKQKNYAKAEQYFLEARKSQSSSDRVDLDLVALYVESGQNDKALEHLRDMSLEYSRDPEVQELLGKLLTEKKDFAAAAQAFEAALQVQPDALRRRALNLALAGIYQELGRTDEAIQRLTELSQTSADAKIHFRIGTLYLHKRDFENARQQFQRSLGIDPNDPEVYSNLGSVLILQERYPEAISVLSRFREFRPEVPGTYFYLGLSYDKLRDYANAMANYQKFLEVSRGQADKLEFQARERLKVLAKRGKRR